MARRPQGFDDSAADPLPSIRGLDQLIPEGRLAAILITDRAVVGTTPLLAGRLRRLAGHILLFYDCPISRKRLKTRGTTP